MVVPRNLLTPLQSQSCSWWWLGGERGVSPEVDDHLHSFERVKLQFLKTAPDSQLLNLLSVSRLVTILNKADQCGVICKLQELDGGSLDVQSLVYREKSSEERIQPWGAPVLDIRVLDENFPSLTSCCPSVRKLLIHWQMEVGTESCVCLFWRVLKAELNFTNRIPGPHKSLVCPDAAGWSAVTCWHHPQTCLLCRQTAGGPVRV